MIQNEYKPYVPPQAGENRLTLTELRKCLWGYLQHDALIEMPFSADIRKGKFRQPPLFRLDSHTKREGLMAAFKRLQLGGAEVNFIDVVLAWNLVWIEIETELRLELGQIFRYSSWTQHAHNVIVGVWGQTPCGSFHENEHAGLWWVWGRKQLKNGGWDRPQRWAIEGLNLSKATVTFELLPLPPLSLAELDAPTPTNTDSLPQQLELW